MLFNVLRCGSVRFIDVVNPTVRCDFDGLPTVRFGAVFRYRKTYGAVWCGAVFKRAKIQRCGAVGLTAPNRIEPLGKTHSKEPCFFFTENLIAVLNFVSQLQYVRSSTQVPARTYYTCTHAVLPFDATATIGVQSVFVAFASDKKITRYALSTPPRTSIDCICCCCSV